MLLRSLLLATVLALPCASQAQEEAVLTPNQDNTLFEDDGGALSNGAGQFLFAGTTNQGDRRRALLAFEIAGAVPAGATVEEVTLTLTMSRTISDAQAVSLHRATAPWGEGTSDAAAAEGAGAAAATGDATWLHTSYDDERWSTPGGDFAASASATQDVTGSGGYTWHSTEGLVADVQRWLDDPSSNHGWIVVGNESQGGTAKRFNSREHAAAGTRPTLRIRFAVPTSTDDEALPSTVRLLGSHPNPFHDAATLTYAVDAAQHVRLVVYDLLGRAVRTLADGPHAPGRYRVRFEARGLPSGVYLGRLIAGRQVQHQQLVLVR